MSDGAAKLCSTLGDAVRRAVQDVMADASLSELSDVENLGRELEKAICSYWGPDHGISPAELLETARDAIKAELKKRHGTPD